MLTCKRIAITGGMASGKSSLAQFFRELGAYVVSADECVHKLLEDDSSLREQLIDLLGQEIAPEGKISRQAIAEKIFNHSELLTQVEAILHPKVFEAIDAEYQAACRQGNFASFVVEMPLLFEVGKENEYDVVIVVMASEEIAKKRMEEKGMSGKEFEKRNRRLIPLEEKKKRADYLLLNNGTLEELKEQAILCYQEILNP